MLFMYFKCNNALYGEWEYLAKGIISAPYHQTESEDVDDWTDEKTTNVSINWLSIHIDRARKLSKKTLVNSQLKQLLFTAELNLNAYDYWIQDDLWLKTLTNNFETMG